MRLSVDSGTFVDDTIMCVFQFFLLMSQTASGDDSNLATSFSVPGPLTAFHS